MPDPKPDPESIAAIALGSNLRSAWGDRTATLQEAVRRVGELGQLRGISSFHDTTPVGILDQPRFLNAALVLATPLSPLELLRSLLAIERAMGRDRTGAVAKGPRIIDLDLLLYADVTMDTPTLTLPHSGLPCRLFVLEPLAEIAASMLVPGTGQTVGELLQTHRERTT